MIFIKLSDQELAIAPDDRQDIIEIMGNATRQPAQQSDLVLSSWYPTQNLPRSPLSSLFLSNIRRKSEK
jgi:hypothetical protein